MKLLRILLFPFSILYGAVTGIRNVLYDTGVLRSVTFSVPIIAIGNLSTGGTGKSPQTEYLIRLLGNRYRVATLSRGYKRKSKGFVLAGPDATAETIGDEPYQFYRKFRNIAVAVDADRKNGIENLLAQHPKPELIILDDAFQHRKVKAHLYILLTAYGDLYADDYILPTGNLREGRGNSKRAHIIVVTKCPKDISSSQMEVIRMKLKPTKDQTVYFSFIEYDNKVYSQDKSISYADLLSVEKVIVAGIAKPEPFFRTFNGTSNNCLTFPDHHNFTQPEIDQLSKISQDKVIITTEKDYVRLEGKLPDDKLFYLPIKSSFLIDGRRFDTQITSYLASHQNKTSIAEACE